MDKLQVSGCQVSDAPPLEGTRFVTLVIKENRKENQERPNGDAFLEGTLLAVAVYRTPKEKQKDSQKQHNGHVV